MGDEGEAAEEFESGVEAGGDLYSMVKDKLEQLLGDMDAAVEGHSGAYGWKYDFTTTMGNETGGALLGQTILPSFEPSVFELKHPDQNIIGVVE